MKKDLEAHISKTVVLDTASSWIYIGVLDDVTEHCAILSQVDVHNSTDTRTSKEMYVYESKTTGVKSNRTKAHVNLNYIVSFSLLNDIRVF